MFMSSGPTAPEDLRAAFVGEANGAVLDAALEAVARWAGLAAFSETGCPIGEGGSRG